MSLHYIFFLIPNDKNLRGTSFKFIKPLVLKLKLYTFLPTNSMHIVLIYMVFVNFCTLYAYKKKLLTIYFLIIT